MSAAAETPPPAVRTVTVPSDGLDELAWGYRFCKTGVAEPLQALASA